MGKADGIKRLEKQYDFVHLIVCLEVHEVVNGRQFTDCTETDFATFINFRASDTLVTPIKDEGLRIGYMIMSIADTIRSHHDREEWINGIFTRCGMTQSYYKKHKSAVTGDDASDTTKRFIKELDEALERAKQFLESH